MGKRRKGKPLNNTTNVDSRPNGDSEKVNQENFEGKGEKRSLGKAAKDLGKENLQIPVEGLGDLNIKFGPGIYVRGVLVGKRKMGWRIEKRITTLNGNFTRMKRGVTF
ncbi:OLC1v1031400C1 [Oldenlandia corymbosa var. corymbosa]|uniref:OLC1v1031400C1 n=1 Tax=Oldenlandia corymbosa var. corymbosa TaxID=529605 RepID=A0AAV1CJ85_OLDCO|nr:OLC1v1031400C1 [Oldenlandia corymbosa var. corymbosa]